MTALVPLDHDTSKHGATTTSVASIPPNDDVAHLSDNGSRGADNASGLPVLPVPPGKRSSTSLRRNQGRRGSLDDQQRQGAGNLTRTQGRVTTLINTAISNSSLGEMPSPRGLNATGAVAVSDDDVSGPTASARETFTIDPMVFSPAVFSHHDGTESQRSHPTHAVQGGQHLAPAAPHTRRTPISDETTTTTNPLTPRLANLSFVSVAVRTPSSAGIPRTPLLGGGFPSTHSSSGHDEGEMTTGASSSVLSHEHSHQHHQRHLPRPAPAGPHRGARSPTASEGNWTSALPPGAHQLRSPVAPLMVAHEHMRRSQHWVPMEPISLPPTAVSAATNALSTRWSVSSGHSAIAAINVPPLSSTYSGNRRGFADFRSNGDLHSQSQRSSVSGNGGDGVGKGQEESRDYSSMGNNQSNSFLLPDAQLMEDDGARVGVACYDGGVLELSQTRSDRRRGHQGSVVTFSGAMVLDNGNGSGTDDDDVNDGASGVVEADGPASESSKSMRQLAQQSAKAQTPIGAGLGGSFKPEGLEGLSGAVVPLWNGDSSFASQRAVSRRAKEVYHNV